MLVGTQEACSGIAPHGFAKVVGLQIELCLGKLCKLHRGI